MQPTCGSAPLSGWSAFPIRVITCAASWKMWSARPSKLLTMRGPRSRTPSLSTSERLASAASCWSRTAHSGLLPMEHRARQHHLQRLGEAIREEITEILEGELGDPRIGLVTLSEVHLSPDGKTAHLLVDISGDDNDAERTLEGLLAARNYIRHELASRLRLRHAP